MRVKHDPISSGQRKPVNLTLDSGVIEAARQIGINLSRACEAGLTGAVRQERARRWEEENREAIEGWNRWIEKNGSPLDRYRAF